MAKNTKIFWIEAVVSRRGAKEAKNAKIFGSKRILRDKRGEIMLCVGYIT
jgi:hypothetical protein